MNPYYVVAIVAILEVLVYAVLLYPDLRAGRHPGPYPSGNLYDETIYAPIKEELLFRGIPFIVWAFIDPTLGMALAALSIVLFMAAHWAQWDSRRVKQSLINLIWKGIVALLWTWVIFTANILWAMLLHSLNNALYWLAWTVQYKVYRKKRKR